MIYVRIRVWLGGDGRDRKDQWEGVYVSIGGLKNRILFFQRIQTLQNIISPFV